MKPFVKISTNFFFKGNQGNELIQPNYLHGQQGGGGNAGGGPQDYQGQGHHNHQQHRGSQANHHHHTYRRRIPQTYQQQVLDFSLHPAHNLFFCFLYTKSSGKEIFVFCCAVK